VKLLFLEIDTERTWAVASLGPASIATALRAQGHDAELLRVPPEGDAQDTIAAITASGAELLGLSLTARQWPRAKELVAQIGRALDLPVIVGGLQPTFSPEQVLAAEGFDAVCLGEGERATVELLGALAAGVPLQRLEIDNLWVRGGGRPQLGPPLAPAAYPLLARDLLDEQHGVVHASTQRGCPFGCSYCAARALSDLYADTAYGGRRPVAQVIDELVAIRRDGELNYVIFLDDTFTVDRPWLAEFCDRYGRELGVPFSLHARPDTVSRELLQALRRAGGYHIVFGVESGSPRVRREIMNRPIEDERIVEAFAWARETGWLVTANYMLGLPGETPDEMEMTLALHQRLAPADFGCFVFQPFPGTQLHTTCRAQGLIPDGEMTLPEDDSRSALRLSAQDHDEIVRFHERFARARAKLAEERSGGG